MFGEEPKDSYIYICNNEYKVLIYYIPFQKTKLKEHMGRNPLFKQFKDNIQIGIYKITSPNGKIYIGQSTNINNRWYKDYKNLNCGGQIKLYNSLNKHGWDKHIHEVIEECSLEQLDKREIYWKQHYINTHGWKHMLFIMLEDGKGGNKSNETKIKMSISSTKNNQKIKAYTLNGTFINTFNTPSEARTILLSHKKVNTGDILKICRRNSKQKSCGGYIFQFEDDDKIQEIILNIPNNIKLKQKTIFQYDLNNKFIKEHPNSYQVEKEFTNNNLKINSSDIRSCCNGKQKTAGGYIWKYGESLINNQSIDIDKINNSVNEFNTIKTQFEKEKLLKNGIKNNVYVYLRSISNNIIKVNYNNNIDFYFPELNIGINILELKDNYKLPKNNNKKLFEYYSSSIKLIQIYSDEWINKQEITKSRILNLLNQTPTKIYARKCEIREIDDVGVKNLFLDSNHIQGRDRSKYKLGLYYNDELVSIMTFNHPRIAIGKTKGSSINTNEYELLRFCNRINTNVVGGASRLFSYFKNNYKPNLIYSFADNRWTSPIKNLYTAIGFNLVSKSQQGYYYTNDFKTRLHRFNFNKGALGKKGYDITKTESVIMNEIGYKVIWDCGVSRFEWKV